MTQSTGATPSPITIAPAVGRRPDHDRPHKMRMVMATALLVLALVLSSVPILADETEAVEVTSDGTVYGYETYGTAHPYYRCTITSIESDRDVLFVSTVLEGYDVTEIAAGAMSGDVRVLVIPRGVTAIGEGAFTGCGSLERVYFLGDRPDIDGAFPEGVEMLRMPSSEGWDDSAGMMEVASVGMDGSTVECVLIEGEWMVMGGAPSDDGTVVIPSEVDGAPVTSVGPYAFAGTMTQSGDVDRLTGILTVVVPDGVTSLRERSFYYCDVESVTLTGSLEAIMDEAFRYASLSGDLVIPDSVSYIGFEAFRDCHGITSLELRSCGFIGEGAFRICKGMETATVAEGTSALSAQQFAYCSSLTQVHLPEGLTSVGDMAFYLCSSLRSVELPSTVVSVGAEAFRENTSLSSLDTGSSLETIGPGAFYGCSALSTVSLPDTLRSVGDRAFAYCSGLTDLYFHGEMPEFGRSVFLNIHPTIHYTQEHSRSWAGFDGDAVMDLSDGGIPWVPVVVIAALVAAAVIAALAIRSRRHAS